MLQRAKSAEQELKATAASKEALEKLQLGGNAKLAVHERQLKTFFEANEVTPTPTPTLTPTSTLPLI
eukprot:scaffold10957_cov32-Phaeocystis_antarctica.AAC.1